MVCLIAINYKKQILRRDIVSIGRNALATLWTKYVR